MGKKGKVNKLAKMSDEERAKYLQHRADMEEEARRRKRELIAQFIKIKLDKEETYSRMNTAKINQGWRYILRKIKCKQMMQDIKALMATFNYLVERKDRQIQALIKALDDGDGQHRRAFQAHTEKLSYFLDIGTQRLDKLQAQYELQKNNLLETWYKEEGAIADSQERSEFQLKLIIYIQDTDFKQFMKTQETAKATEVNDARLEHEEEMRGTWKPKQQQLELCWSQLRQVYSSFVEQHKPIMAHYDILKEKDEFYQRDIARNEAQIQQATELLENLHTEYINITHNSANKLQRMRNRKEELAARYKAMQRTTKREETRSNTSLEVMVNCSQDAIQHLKKYKTKLNKCLQLYKICSKYETHQDIVAFSQVETEQEDVDYEHLDPDMIAEVKQYKKLDKFRVKLNRVKLQTVCLKAEKSELLKENAQLKHYIKRYLTEMALRGGRDRPLSVKLQCRVQKIDAIGRAMNRPVTCIEGALSNAVIHEKRMKIQQKKDKEMGWRSFPRVQCWM